MSIDRISPDFFIGTEVESSPAKGLNTLFVVGIQSGDKIKEIIEAKPIKDFKENKEFTDVKEVKENKNFKEFKKHFKLTTKKFNCKIKY